MRLALALFLALAACVEFPALDGTVAPENANAPFPALVPLDPLIAQAGMTDNRAATEQADMTPRLTNLRARAARLRGPVIPAPIRNRMLRGIR